ncbi:S41 family peptidase [Croceivirga thetidis]|uniref:Carboxyl-terminal protease n=1 Tax=Croceivirga thetidis TaxID=2721623 RepID=A0ABX1GRP8_9FLAO|nr:S41 family peptidase [Croceivirga thetidis]NKI32627.1 carboxyl-terminal protease [Croceivirga thetidis]
MKKLFYLLFGSLLFLASCNNDDDGLNIDGNPDPTNTDVTVQNFIWQAMNLWYFWQQDVPDLADNRFSTDEEYTTFLAGTSDPEDFIQSILFQEDRFTFYNSDYTTLVNNLNGVSKSNGLEFSLRFTDASQNEIVGIVEYIVEGSDAATKAIQRGDIFTRAEGQVLTINNYIDLLFEGTDTYTLTLAEFQNGTLVETGEEVTLTKFEGLEENPILIADTFDVNGTTVAYLMYNRFNRNFNSELNDAFGQFIAAGATELIVDFRYNPGGSVNTSRLLASMIYGTNTNELYIRQRWNDKLQEAFEGNLEDFFANNVNGQTLNSMNLSKVYVITSSGTASASELVINGLEPYIDVVIVGETTRGKNEFSITLVDDPEREGSPFVYTSSREDQINPDNSWAIQPLVGRNENADGFSDYTNGIQPDIVLEEDITNLGVLGDPTEPLLARALQEFDGGLDSKQNFEVKVSSRFFTSSKMEGPLKDNMFYDIPKAFFE